MTSATFAGAGASAAFAGTGSAAFAGVAFAGTAAAFAGAGRLGAVAPSFAGVVVRGRAVVVPLAGVCAEAAPARLTTRREVKHSRVIFSPSTSSNQLPTPTSNVWELEVGNREFKK